MAIHNELRLISKVIETGDMRTVVRARMVPSLFRNPEARVMFEEMWRYFHDAAHYGKTPKIGWMESKFAGFALYEGIQEDVEELVEYVRRDTLSQRIWEVLNETYDQLYSDPHEALKELYQRAGELKSLSISKGANFMFHEVTDEIWERYLEKKRLRATGGVRGIPWPWIQLNRVTGGLEPEQLIVIYGKEKSMKTMFAIQLGVDAWLWHNQRVLVYSAEMPRDDMQDRIAACAAQLDYGRIDLGDLNEEDERYYQEALNFIRDEAKANPSNKDPFIYYASDADADKRGSVALVRSLAEELEVDLVIVDSFYRMQDDRSGTAGLDWKVVGNVAQDLKAMAKHLHVPVIGITQANTENKFAFSRVVGMEVDLGMMVEKVSESEDFTDLNLYFSVARKIKRPGFRLRVQPYTRFSFEGWLEYQNPDGEASVEQGERPTVKRKRPPPPKGPPTDAQQLVQELVHRHLQ